MKTLYLWDAVQLNTLATNIASGKTVEKAATGTYPVYGSTGMIGWSEGYEYEGERILVARVGANAGRVNRVTGRYGISDNTLMVKCSPKLDFKYAFYQLVRCRLNDIVFGSGQPLLTGTQLKELHLLIPQEISEQREISNCLSVMDTEITALESKLHKYRQIKQGMMHNLLTGRIRLI